MQRGHRRALVFGLIGVLFLLAVALVRTRVSVHAPNGAKPPRARQKIDLPREVDFPQEVDILKLIDLQKDAVAGAWRFEDQTLVTPSVPFGRLQVPYIPPEEYDVTVVVERLGGTSGFSIGLAFGETQFLVMLDGRDESLSGLDLVDRQPFYSNETTFREKLFLPGKPSKIVCSVRKAGVAVSVGDKAVINWKADYARLSLHPNWRMSGKHILFIGCWKSVYRITRMTIKPVSEPGRNLR